MKFLKIAAQREIIIASLKVALVVGIVLNLINQGNAITHLEISSIQWQKLLLTFCVPYLVSTYASVTTELRNE